MADYKAPLRDMRFVLNEVFEISKLWAELPGLAEIVDEDTAAAILEEAGKVTGGVVAPLNRSGDEEGCSWNNGAVTTPAGFREAYKTYAEGGWVGVSGAPEFGGMGMPKVIGAQVEEMVNSANLSFGLYPMLTSGACLSILNHASEELKEKYLPNMYAGTWAGSMCLTEPHCGTDLGIIRTKAEPQADGSYKISGTKIFITGGEHDLTENIIHLVLAKLPDAPAGPKGISLFLVPKVMVNADGSLGEKNSLSCGSIEHKMGIKASATCVMNFDGATGWIVDEPNKGLNAMFTMMNYERLGVGIQGLSLGERSYQNAIEYARDRLQSRAPTGPVNKDKAADPIIVHPDVRRMLLTMKAFNEGNRALAYHTAKLLDQAHYAAEEEARADAEAQLAFLTPICKAFMTDTGLEATLLGQQVFGGHGFIREWGQEQQVRDCRIAQIYEGTNGIQALDLLGRKVLGSQGKLLKTFTKQVHLLCKEVEGNATFGEYAKKLAQLNTQWGELTTAVGMKAMQNPEEVGAASVDYLAFSGYVVHAYFWLKMALVAQAKLDAGTTEVDFYKGKLATQAFYYQRLLPRAQAHAEALSAGASTLMDIAVEQF